MKYFVSIENTSYFLWQIELLIESFKRLGLQDDLVIGIAENSNPVIQRYTKNLLAHPHKFVHPNQSPKPINKFYALLTAIEQKLLPKPFVVLHPDMVLVKPVQEFGPGFLLQPEPSYEVIRQSLPTSISMGNIVGIGEGVDNILFHNAYVYLKNYTGFKPEIAAWMQATWEQIRANKLEVKMALMEQPLPHTALEAHFIHYRHGIPTLFHKRNFTFTEDSFMSDYTDPFEAIYMNNSTRSIDYLCRLIEFYRVGS